jgi:hypothetical protein
MGAALVVMGVGMVMMYGLLHKVVHGKANASGGHPYATVGEAINDVLDDEYKAKLREASSEKLQKVIDRDAAEIEGELLHNAKEVGEYIHTEVARQMDEALASLRKNVETAQTFLVETAAKNGAVVEKTSQEMVNHILMATNGSEKLINDAAATSAEAIKNQATVAAKDFQQQIETYKEHMTTAFEQNMTHVVAYYVRKAMADRLELDDQLGFIIAELEANKQAMIEDIKR